MTDSTNDESLVLLDNSIPRSARRKRGKKEPVVTEQVVQPDDKRSEQLEADLPASSPANPHTADADTSLDGLIPQRSGSLGRKHKLSNEMMPLHVAFFVTIFVGLVAEIQGWPLVAGGALLLYFAFGFAVPKRIRNSERFADSLYYIGFILTLWALFFSMSPLFARTVDFTSRDMIEKFGIALLTTVLGMTLRIALVQMRQTASDQEEESRAEIAEYVQKLNLEVRATLEEVHNFRTSAIEQAKGAATHFTDGMREISRQSGEAVATSNSRLLDGVNEVVAQIRDSTSEVLERLRRLDVPTDVISSQLRQSAEALSTEITSLRSVLERRTNDFASALGGSVDSVNTISAEMRVLELSIKAVSDNVMNAGALATASVESNKRFAEQATGAVESLARFQHMAQGLTSILEQLNRAVESRGEKYIGELDELSIHLRDSVSRAQGDASQLKDTVVMAATEIRDAIRAANTK